MPSFRLAVMTEHRLSENYPKTLQILCRVLHPAVSREKVNQENGWEMTMEKRTFQPKWKEQREAKMSAAIEKQGVEIEHIKKDLAEKPSKDAVDAKISSAETRIEASQTAWAQKILGERFEKIKFFITTGLVLGGLFLGSLWSGISAINQTRSELKSEIGEVEKRIMNEQRASEQRILSAIHGSTLSGNTKP